MFYTGAREDLDYQIGSAVTEKINLSGYLDLNFHIDYTFNKNWQVFLKANNLTTQRYERWVYYPSQSIQAFAGIKYIFKLGDR